MGKYIDFIVNYDPDPEIVGQRIIQSLTINRLRAKKPSIIFVTGDSGEGKSYTALKIVRIVNEYYGVDTVNYLNDQIVYTPLEYTKKLDNILHNKEYKDFRLLMIDEAREVIRSKLWYTFVNQAISDCNAMSRRIKPLVLLVVSQFIADIDSDVRRTLVYYAKCQRPLSGRTQVAFSRIWKDDTDIERPRLRKRKIRGYLERDGRRSIYYPAFEVAMPPRDIVKVYEKQNFESKSKIIRKKLEDLMKILEREIGHEFDKVDQLVQWYLERPDTLRMMLQRKYNKIKVKKEFQQMHDLTNIEVQEFERMIIEKMAQKGLAASTGG